MTTSDRPTINLRTALNATARQHQRPQVESWFTEHEYFHVDLEGLRRGITALKATVKDPSKLAERTPVLDWLVQYGEEHRPVGYSHGWRERQGGRRYFEWTEGWGGLVLQPARDRPASGLSVQNVPRIVRAAGLRAAPGRVLIMGDIDRANLSILGRLARDPVLLEDLRTGDPHQRAADPLGAHRDVGKLLNNALVCLAEPVGLRLKLAEEDVKVTQAQAEDLYSQWWGRYASARGLRDRFLARIRAAAAANSPARIVAPDNRRFSFDRAQVRGVPLKNRRKKGPKSIWSSLFRATEGCALDEALYRLQPRRKDIDLQLVVTMFDGGVWSIPEEHALAGAAAVERALIDGLAAVGVQGTATVKVNLYWRS